MPLATLDGGILFQGFEMAGLFADPGDLLGGFAGQDHLLDILVDVKKLIKAGSPGITCIFTLHAAPTTDKIHTLGIFKPPEFTNLLGWRVRLFAIRADPS